MEDTINIIRKATNFLTGFSLAFITVYPKDLRVWGLSMLSIAAIIIIEHLIVKYLRRPKPFYIGLDGDFKKGDVVRTNGGDTLLILSIGDSDERGTIYECKIIDV